MSDQQQDAVGGADSPLAGSLSPSGGGSTLGAGGLGLGRASFPDSRTQEKAEMFVDAYRAQARLNLMAPLISAKPSLHACLGWRTVRVRLYASVLLDVGRGLCRALHSLLSLVAFLSSSRSHFRQPSSSGFLFSLETNMRPDKINLLCLCWTWKGWGWVIKGSPRHFFPLIYIPAVRRSRIAH